MDELLKKGDELIETKLGKLVDKMNKLGGFNKLSKLEQAKYSKYQEKFQNYVPRRDSVGIDKNFLEQLDRSGELEKISRGTPYKDTRPDSSFPLYVDEFHYESDPDTGEPQIIGSGYHVPNPKDKLSAIVVDNRWKQERLPKIYDFKRAADPYAKEVTEKEAVTREMGPEVLKEFYSEWLAELEVRAQESVCQPVRMKI